MITRIDFIEKSNYMESNFICIDIINRNIKIYKNDYLISEKNKNIDFDKIQKLLAKYIVFWNQNYINNLLIDGNYSKIIIYTNKEKLIYHFRNKFPPNYQEFLKEYKKLVSEIE